MVYSCIISLAGIPSDRDGDLLAGPATSGTCGITTRKSPHDIRVVIIDTTLVMVLLVKLEVKVVLAKEVGHVVVEGWVHGPIFGRLRFLGRPGFLRRRRFLGRHGDNSTSD